jgi:hypothetical protein
MNSKEEQVFSLSLVFAPSYIFSSANIAITSTSLPSLLIFLLSLSAGRACSILTSRGGGGWSQKLQQKNAVFFINSCTMHCKKVSDFPVPSRDVTNQTLPGRE